MNLLLDRPSLGNGDFSQVSIFFRVHRSVNFLEILEIHLLFPCGIEIALPRANQ